MTVSNPKDPNRFRLLASYIAGRPVDVAEASAGEPAHTDSKVIFVSAGRPLAEQRREMLIQSALLGAGSLDRRLVKALRARPSIARRYLALEGHRVLAELAGQIPLAAELCPDGAPRTATADESLDMAKSPVEIADPPDWFGVIRPSRLLAPSAGPGSQATDKELRLQFDPVDLPEADDDGDAEPARESKILKLFESPLFNSRTVSDFFRKMLGSSRSPGDSAAGAEMQVRAIRRANAAARTPVLCPRGSVSPMTAIPVPPQALAARSIRSGTNTTTAIGRIGAGSSTSR